MARKIGNPRGENSQKETDRMLNIPARGELNQEEVTANAGYRYMSSFGARRLVPQGKTCRTAISRKCVEMDDRRSLNWKDVALFLPSLFPAICQYLHCTR